MPTAPEPTLDCTRPRPVGRPQDPAKHAAIIDAAREHFFTHGFAATAIEAVAASAGVSKVTIYKQFTDKVGLFEAVVRSQSSAMTLPIADWRDIAGDLEGALNRFGCKLLSFLMNEDHMALDNLLSLDLAKHPDLARRFFTAGPGRCRSILADVLHRADHNGELAVPEPQSAAEDLLSIWKGFGDLEQRFGVGQPMTPEEIERRVHRGTKIFLRAYAVD